MMDYPLNKMVEPMDTLIDDIKVRIYGYNHRMTIVVNTALKDVETIYNMIQSQWHKPLRLIGLDVPHWNDDLSPWFAPRLSKHDSNCNGYANQYLSKVMHVVESLVSSGDTTIIACYSLAGLFALYSVYQCDLFDRVVSASGSFWFPQWMDYVNGHTISSRVKSIYFSFGDKESVTKHPMLATTPNNTEILS